ncbi:MAG: DUF4149 domain-containing protein [Burkholderiaceae bacterium]
MRAWPLWLAALWWGSLTTLIFGIVPLLFAYLPEKAMAGNIAAQLFGVQAMVSTVLGIALLGASIMGTSAAWSARAGGARGFVLAGVLLALLVEFAVAPRIVARSNLPLWHSVGSVMLLLQWLCAAITFWRMAWPQPSAQV